MTQSPRRALTISNNQDRCGNGYTTENLSPGFKGTCMGLKESVLRLEGLKEKVFPLSPKKGKLTRENQTRENQTE